MRGKTIFILLCVLVILVAVAMLYEGSRNRATRSTGELVFDNLDTEQVDRLEIRIPGEDEVILAKQNGTWRVETEDGYEAELQPVTDILDRLPSFYADQVVSTNPENRAIFAVDSTGTEVAVFQAGREVGRFIVGKPGPDFLSTYVRPTGSDKVLQVPEYLPHIFQSRKTWRAKKIFTLDGENIQKYEYSSPTRGQVVMNRGANGIWQMAEPDSGAADANFSRIAVNALAKLNAIGFADTIDATAAGFDPDTTWIRGTLADGSTHELQIGLPASENRVFVRRKGNEQIFVLPIGGIRTMMPPAGVLLQTEPQAGGEFQIEG